MKKAKLNNSKKVSKKEEEVVQNSEISVRMGVITEPRDSPVIES